MSNSPKSETIMIARSRRTRRQSDTARSPRLRSRSFNLELLEDRRLLAAAPFQTDAAEVGYIQQSSIPSLAPINSLTSLPVFLNAQHVEGGFIPAQVAEAQLLDSPPEISAEQRSLLESRHPQSTPILPVDGPIIVGDSPPVAGVDGTSNGGPRIDLPDMNNDPAPSQSGGTPGTDGPMTDGPTDFTVFEDTRVTDGSSVSSTAEPSVGSLDNLAFVTANWFASISTNNGATFSYINPSTTFPATGDFAGGFCCDQRVAYDDVRGQLFWYLQYSRTGNGSNDIGAARVAWKTSSSQGNWNYIGFTPEDFGLGRGLWLDYPNMQVSDNYLYATSNIFFTGGGYSGSVMWRMNLDHMKAGLFPSIDYVTGSTGSIAPVQGAQETMYLAARTGTNSMTLYTWPDSSSAPTSQTISGLNTTFNGTNFCPDGNGNNWCGFGANDGRIQSGWVTDDQIGFQWNSAQGTSRPFPFVRVLELNRYTLGVTSQPDIWFSTQTWQYAGIASNGRGAIGGVATNQEQASAGFPRVEYLIKDDVSGSWEVHFAAGGNLGHPSRWGDYQSAQADDDFNNTWIATGYIGLTNPNHYEVYFFHFGRERDIPTGSRANLLGSLLNAQEPIAAGQQFSVTYQVANNGSLGSPATTAEFYLSRNGHISRDDYLLGTRNVVGLSPGTFSVEEQILLTLPPPTDPFWAGSGNYTIGMIVDAGSAVQESSEGDNRNRGLGADSDEVSITVYNDTNDQISEATSIALGTTGGSVDHPVDVDIYAFSASAGQTVGFDADSNFDTYLRLFDAAGTELAFDDDTVGPLPEIVNNEAYLEFTFAQSGTYYLGLSSYSNRNYDPVTGGNDNLLATETGTYSLILTDLTSAAFRVTQTHDSGNGIIYDGVTLREAIDMANVHPGHNTVTFDATVFASPQTITLGGSELRISTDMTINGPGTELLTVDGNGSSRVFNVDDGVAADHKSFVITEMTITGGNAAGIAGGAILNYESMSIRAMEIVGNQARFGGGILAGTSSTTTIIDSTITGNVASQNGGGISNAGTMNISNSTISGNSAGGGGGIVNFGNPGSPAILTVSNSTFTGNTSSNGPFWNSNGYSAGVVTIDNSIVKDVVSNTGTLNGNFNLFGGSVTISGSGNLQTIDPMLGPLQYNGGPTRTHLLLPGSPAINAGDPSYVFNAGQFDQRGAPFVRVYDGRIDIGAIETAPTQLVVDTLSDADDGNYSTGNLSLREAIILANAVPGAVTITFDAALNGQVIDINSQLPTITDAVSIMGPGADLLTIDAHGGGDDVLDGDGFGIFVVNDGTSALIDVEISGLTLTGADTVTTGAISNLENLRIDRTAIVANRGRFGGGIGGSGILTIFNSTIANNFGSQNGGGISFSGTLHATNVTISGNQAVGLGGGIISAPFGVTGILNLTNTTVSGNSAGAGGSGVSFFNTYSSTTATFTNSIINNQVNGVGGNGTTLSGNHNLFAGSVTITGSNNLPNTDPMLGPLANNGGPTQTHALLPGSPAINTGDPATQLSHRAAVIGTSPSLFWELNESNGTTANDSVGSADGTFHGVTLDKPGAGIGTGRAISFDGVDDYVEGHLTTAELSGDTYSVSLWFKANQIGTQTLMNLARGDDNNASAAILELTSDDRIRFLNRIPAGATGGENIYSSSGYGTADWHHVVAVRSGTSMRIYLDGVLSVFGVASGSIDFDTQFSLGNLRVGERQFDGLMDDFSVFNRPLNLTEIQTMFAGRATSDFDQRGIGFDRVIDGLVDIGSYEVNPTALGCDFNGDTVCNGIDIDLLQANIVTGPPDPGTFDLTGDGLVNLADRDEWLVQAGAANLLSGNPYLLGDANLDGVVDGQDFIAWNTNKFTSASAWTGGDFNADGVVDGQDFIAWNTNKFTSADVGRGASPIVHRARIHDHLFALSPIEEERGFGGEDHRDSLCELDALFAAYPG